MGYYKEDNNMITNFNQSISVSAASTIATSSGENKVISYMSANIAMPGGISFSNSIQDTQEYFRNEETVKTDFADFQARVLEISKQHKEAEV